MDTLKTVLDSTGIIMQNHIILCIVYALFFIVALIMRRSADNIERKAGKVMIIASVPGLLISVTGIGLFIYATVRGMTMVDDSRELNPDQNETPYHFPLPGMTAESERAITGDFSE